MKKDFFYSSEPRGQGNKPPRMAKLRGRELKLKLQKTFLFRGTKKNLEEHKFSRTRIDFSRVSFLNLEDRDGKKLKKVPRELSPIFHKRFFLGYLFLLSVSLKNKSRRESIGLIPRNNTRGFFKFFRNL